MLFPQNTLGVMTCVVEDGLLGALRQAITSALKDLWPWGTDICCLKIIRELLQKAAGFENTMHQISFTFFRLWAKGTHKSPIEVNAREKVLFLQTNMQLIRHGLCTAPCLHFARSSSLLVGFVLSVSVCSCLAPRPHLGFWRSCCQKQLSPGALR